MCSTCDMHDRNGVERSSHTRRSVDSSCCCSKAELTAIAFSIAEDLAIVREQSNVRAPDARLDYPLAFESSNLANSRHRRNGIRLLLLVLLLLLVFGYRYRR